MSDSDTTVKRLSVLKTTAGVILVASFLLSFLSTVNGMAGVFTTTSLSDSVSTEAEIDKSMDHILTTHKAAVPIGVVAFFVWVTCRRRLRATDALCKHDSEGSAGSET